MGSKVKKKILAICIVCLAIYGSIWLVNYRRNQIWYNMAKEITNKYDSVARLRKENIGPDCKIFVETNHEISIDKVELIFMDISTNFNQKEVVDYFEEQHQTFYYKGDLVFLSINFKMVNTADDYYSFSSTYSTNGYTVWYSRGIEYNINDF